jgi:hypothetical protein
MSPQSDSTGDQLLLFPTYEAAASQFVGTTHQLKEIFLLRFLKGSTIGCPHPKLRFRRHIPPGTTHVHTALLAHRGRHRLRWADADGLCPNLQPHERVREQVRDTLLLRFRLPEKYLTLLMSISIFILSHIEANIEVNFDLATPIDVPSAPEITNAAGVTASGTVLGKRSRERCGMDSNRSAGPDDDDSSSNELPQKRGKSMADGVLGAEGSTKRIRRAPAIRTQPSNNGKSKAVGRGAGRLTSTTARGVYHRPLLGPSVPQGSVEALAHGKPSWIEEREEELRHDMGSILSQRSAPRNPEITEDLEVIPKTLTAWQLLLLQTTQADLERGAVGIIKCRLCPTERFKTWACFCRHCRDCEEHPAQILCCERCGIYFGRQDSMRRHYESATKACCKTLPAEAARRKDRAQQLLLTFQARLEYCQRAGEELGPNFAEMAREELPSRSKKVTRKRKLEGTSSQDSNNR